MHAREPRWIMPDGGAPYKPLPPDQLYLTENEWTARLGDAMLARLTPLRRARGQRRAHSTLAREQGRRFCAERADAKANVFEAVAGISSRCNPRASASSWRCGAKARASAWRIC